MVYKGVELMHPFYDPHPFQTHRVDISKDAVPSDSSKFDADITKAVNEGRMSFRKATEMQAKRDAN